MAMKLIRLPNTLPKKQKHSLRQQRKNKPHALNLHRLAHEMINQLTVIQLSCFKLRGDAGQGLSRSETDNIEQVEKAVAEITLLVEDMIRPAPMLPQRAHPTRRATSITSLTHLQDRARVIAIQE